MTELTHEAQTVVDAYEQTTDKYAALAAVLRAATDTNDLIQQLAGLARRKHYTCEDSWYNCPQSPDGSANDNAGAECDCGADEHNAKVDAICAALSLPEPEGPKDEEIMQLACSSLGYEYTKSLLSEPVQCIGALDALPSELVAFARALLARWGRPSIEPVPVSERLPKAEDCDAQGNCWLTNDSMEPGWVLDNPEKCTNWTHWLPHYALPIPTLSNEENK